MPFTAFLFVAAGLACLLGLVASLAQPAWFRVNGKVLGRWKIARLWLLLVAICTVFALVHREPPAPGSVTATEVQTESATVIQVDPNPSAFDGLSDAAMTAEEAAVIDMAPPPPVAPPPPSKRAPR
jgi:hypothetical protein